MGKATAIFDADDGAMQAAFKRLDRGLAGAQMNFGKLRGYITAALAAAPLVALEEGIRRALDTGGELNDEIARTGERGRDLVIIGQEFKNAGKAAEDVAPSLAKMQKALEDGTADGTIAQLGIDLHKLRDMTPTEQFHTLGAAINGLQDPAERVSAAMAIFGKQGATLLSVFDSNGFGDAAAQVGEQAAILEKDAGLFDDVSDKLALAGLKTQGFFVGVADKVAPVLKPLLDRFATMDFAAWGQQLGDVVAFFVQALADGRIGDIILDELQIAMGELANILMGIIGSVSGVLFQSLAEVFHEAMTLLSIATTSEFWAGLGNSLLAAAQSFIALMLEGIADVLDQIAKIPGLSKVKGGAEGARATAEDLRGRAANNATTGFAQLWSSAVEPMTKRIQDSFTAIAQEGVKGWKNGTNFIDTKPLYEQLDKDIGAVLDSVAAVTTQSQAADANKKPLPGGTDALQQLGQGAVNVSSLTSIGGNFGGFGADPLLSENQRQTSLLKQLVDQMKPRMDFSAGHPAVYR